ncbi:Uncharacterised protein [Achromobacter xylosoxidans]|nr:Uncharacterised protein [Achromobacter xylosoxidans]CUJ28635.1 Uncharacterised protein [Achromobacter xylosoxidans]
MQTITAYVSHGNSHILNSSRTPRACRRWRMRSCEKAMAR